MNNSYITRLENKYDIIIHAGTIQNFSGNWLKMQFDMAPIKVFAMSWSKPKSQFTQRLNEY